jgi:hypothetical protein
VAEGVRGSVGDDLLIIGSRQRRRCFSACGGEKLKASKAKERRGEAPIWSGCSITVQTIQLRPKRTSSSCGLLPHAHRQTRSSSSHCPPPSRDMPHLGGRVVLSAGDRRPLTSLKHGTCSRTPGKAKSGSQVVRQQVLAFQAGTEIYCRVDASVSVAS